jgi:hypothetical protein
MDESNNLKLLLDFSAVGTATLTNRINDLHCNAHIYYHQWKELNLHQNEVVKLLKLLRYYEGKELDIFSNNNYNYLCEIVR